MAVNKVVRSDGTTLIDLTGDTVTTSDHIMEGYVGHLRNGTSVTGTGKIAASEQAALDALVRYSNEVTGESDETISEAVETLVDGYSGGGSLFTVEKIKTYTVEESWENDEKGNPGAIKDALGINISELTNCSESFLCIFRNNNAIYTSYRVDFIQYAYDTSSNHYGSFSVRQNVSAARSAYVNSTSLWASVGTIIDVYKVKINL